MAAALKLHKIVTCDENDLPSCFGTIYSERLYNNFAKQKVHLICVQYHLFMRVETRLSAKFKFNKIP